jgi:hypothetical protein
MEPFSASAFQALKKTKHKVKPWTKIDNLPQFHKHHAMQIKNLTPAVHMDPFSASPMLSFEYMCH